MKKVYTILLVCFFISKLALAQEKAQLTGKILANQQALPFATIVIKETGQGISADEQGFFQFDQLNPGEITLQVSAIGYQTLSQKVVLIAGQNQDVAITLKADNLGLNEVVVSATRYNLSRSEAPVVVSVLNARLFDATQSVALSEGLSFKPGVRVETNCQNCGFTQVRLNGLEGAYSQILINSRAVFSALNSVYGLDQIPTNIIERVEIVRSGGSSLYGSNAIAGTINVITKEPILNTWEVANNFSLIDGSVPDNTLTFNGSLVSDQLNSGVTFYGMFRNRDVFDANGDGFSEITRLENNTFGIKGFLRPDEYRKLSFDFNAIREYRRGGDRLDLIPHFTDISEELDHNTLIAGLTYEQNSKNLKNQFSAYVSGQSTQRDSFYGGLGGGRTREDSLAALNAYGDTQDLALVGGTQFVHYLNREHVFTIGAEYQLSDVNDQILGYNRVVDQQVNSFGTYAQFDWQISTKLKALVGTRLDYVDVQGLFQVDDIRRNVDVRQTVLSPRLTLMYKVNDQWQFRGGYARGFRAPQAFNEDLHISSVGGEPQFVILSEELETEFSDAFTASLNFSDYFNNTQVSFLLEGFYTDLQNPFTTVSTGAVLLNGSILEEVRNGAGSVVSGINFEMSLAPSPAFFFQLGGTWQRANFKEDQILFEPELANELEPTVSLRRLTRNPNLYGFLTSNWKPNKRLNIDMTGTYTGSMIVPRVVSESGFLDLVESNPFFELNLKTSYKFKVADSFKLILSGGIQNIFNSYQDDFDMGATRDSDYIYGPARPRTFFIGIKIGSWD